MTEEKVANPSPFYPTCASCERPTHGFQYRLCRTCYLKTREALRPTPGVCRDCGTSRIDPKYRRCPACHQEYKKQRELWKGEK